MTRGSKSSEELKHVSTLTSCDSQWLISLIAPYGLMTISPLFTCAGGYRSVEDSVIDSISICPKCAPSNHHVTALEKPATAAPTFSLLSHMREHD